MAIARRLSKAPNEYVANTAAAAVTRELCGRGVPLRPGSKIRYLLADGKGRAMGFLDGNEIPDFSRYEEMLREAWKELLYPLCCRGVDRNVIEKGAALMEVPLEELIADTIEGIQPLNFPRGHVLSTLLLCGPQWTYMLDLLLYGSRCLP